jgi:transcriptional regulator GlxA family with amidase domain
MQRVVIVAFDGATTLDVTGPAEVLAAAARRVGGRAYAVDVVSVGGGERTMTSSLRIHTGELTRIRPRPSDLVIVAGGDEPGIRAAMADQRLLTWLRHAAPVVGRMTSVCSGAFLLAAAGLLDGKRAATHWSACDRLEQMFPRVTVDRTSIFVADGRTWTSAGVTTGIDMALAIVEEDHGAAVADAIAASLVLYLRRPGFQSQFSEALVSQAASSDPFGRVIAWIRAHLRHATVESAARASALSVRTFHRRCRDRLGVTPAKLIDKLRVEHARTLLATSDVPAKQLADECGFGTATNMRRSFTRELGVGPREFRLLHARRAA